MKPPTNRIHFVMDSVKAMAKCALVIFSSLFSLGKGHYECWGSPPQRIFCSRQQLGSFLVSPHLNLILLNDSLVDGLHVKLFPHIPWDVQVGRNSEPNSHLFETWTHCGCQPWDRLKQVHRQRPLDSLSVGSLLVPPWPLGAVRMTRFHTFPYFHLMLADVIIPYYTLIRITLGHLVSFLDTTLLRLLFQIFCKFVLGCIHHRL